MLPGERTDSKLWVFAMEKVTLVIVEALDEALS